MDAGVVKTLLENGGWWGVTTVVLICVIGVLWRGREMLIERLSDKREQDVKALLDALNANTSAMQATAEAVQTNTEAIGAFSGLATARAMAFDAHVVEFRDHSRRVNDALQQRAVR